MTIESNLQIAIAQYMAAQGVEQSIHITSSFQPSEDSINLWHDKADTAHGVVTGVTGDLKHAVIPKILEGLAMHAVDTLWVTDDGSLEEFASKAGLNYIRLATEPWMPTSDSPIEQPFRINPLWLETDSEGRVVEPGVDDIVATARILLEMIRAIGNYVSPNSEPQRGERLSLIYSALNSFYMAWVVDHPTTEPKLSNFIPYLIQTNLAGLKGQQVAEELTLFYGSGPFAGIFDGNCQIAKGAGVTIFSFERIAKSPARGAIALTLATIFGRKCRFELKRKDRKVLLLNHDWMSHNSPQFAGPFSELYKEYRRYNCGSILVCEEMSDYLALVMQEQGDGKDGILENTNHHLSVGNVAGQMSIKHSSFNHPEPELNASTATALKPVSKGFRYLVAYSIAGSEGPKIRSFHVATSRPIESVADFIALHEVVLVPSCASTFSGNPNYFVPLQVSLLAGGEATDDGPIEVLEHSELDFTQLEFAGKR